MSEKVKRAGMSVDTRGSSGHFPFIPNEWSSASRTSWIGRILAERATIMAIAERRHVQNESVRLATVKRQTPILPPAEERARIAKAEQKILEQSHANVRKIATEIADERRGHKFFDYEGREGGGVTGFMARAELRSALKAMDADKRDAAMKLHKFKIAALEQPGALSGIPDLMHSQLSEELLRQKHPEIKDNDEAMRAVELYGETLKPVTLAVENELRSVNAPIKETDAPAEPVATWA